MSCGNNCRDCAVLRLCLLAFVVCLMATNRRKSRPLYIMLVAVAACSALGVLTFSVASVSSLSVPQTTKLRGEESHSVRSSPIGTMSMSSIFYAGRIGLIAILALLSVRLFRKRVRRSRLIVAIDGPAGAGKSTVARLVSSRLGLAYIDTGAIYRSIAVMAKSTGISFTDEEGIVELTSRISISKRGEVLVDGKRLAAEIRGSTISLGASEIGKLPGVRQSVVSLLQRTCAKGGYVLEGRDTATVVAPNAQVKVFLFAKPEERARRRIEQMSPTISQSDSPNGIFQKVMAEIEMRDSTDVGREHGPLFPAPDALLVDSTYLSIDDVVGQIVKNANEA